MTTRELIALLAELLAAAGVGKWRPTGPDYGPTETGITGYALPSTTDRAIAITPYDTDDPLDGPAVRFVQLRSRGRARQQFDAGDLADLAFAVLHDRHHPDPRVARIVRVSSVPLGPDGNGRQERTDNYQIILNNPEASA